MGTTVRRRLTFGAIFAALLGATAAPAQAQSATDFSVLLVRAAVSASDAQIVVQGRISNGAVALGLRPKIVVVAAVSQTCATPDGSTAVERSTLDSVTAPHFFTTTARLLDNGGSDSTWQVTVILAAPQDASICGDGEQPAAAPSVDGISGVAFLSPLGLGSPPSGTSIYSFAFSSGHQVLAPPQLTFTTA